MDQVYMRTIRLRFFRQVDTKKLSPKEELTRVLTDERAQRRPIADITPDLFPEPNSMAYQERVILLK